MSGQGEDSSGALIPGMLADVTIDGLEFLEDLGIALEGTGTTAISIEQQSNVNLRAQANNNNPTAGRQHPPVTVTTSALTATATAKASTTAIPATTSSAYAPHQQLQQVLYNPPQEVRQQNSGEHQIQQILVQPITESMPLPPPPSQSGSHPSLTTIPAPATQATQQQQQQQLVSPITARLNLPLIAATQGPFYAATAGCPVSIGTGTVQAPITMVPSTGNIKRKRSLTPGVTKVMTTLSHHEMTREVVSESEDGQNRRRLDRNLREQQRSHRITEQIGHLRDVLSAAKFQFKPDKYSTLVAVVEYIKQLQGRSALLDDEHKKLLDTITKTNEMINSPYYQTSGQGESNDPSNDAAASTLLEDENAVFVNGLDYANVFHQCGVALAVASIDGRFLDCNSEFESLTGFRKDELVTIPPEGANGATGSADIVQTNLSLFNLLAREDMEQVFDAMSRILKTPLEDAGGNCETQTPNNKKFEPSRDCWSGCVKQSRRRDIQIRMNVTLVRNHMKCPKFFQCALSPME